VVVVVFVGKALRQDGINRHEGISHKDNGGAIANIIARLLVSNATDNAIEIHDGTHAVFVGHGAFHEYIFWGCRFYQATNGIVQIF
jgi:hypothetical protein